MSRYIDMSNYKDLFNEEYLKTMKQIELGESHLDNLAEGFTEADHVIARMPIADVKPVVRGEWVKTPRTHLVPTGELSMDEHGNIYAKREHKTIFRYRCSCCGLTEDIESDFCPNCGAEMHDCVPETL